MTSNRTSADDGAHVTFAAGNLMGPGFPRAAFDLRRWVGVIEPALISLAFESRNAPREIAGGHELGLERRQRCLPDNATERKNGCFSAWAGTCLHMGFGGEGRHGIGENHVGGRGGSKTYYYSNM
jgi:hypothetical protein